MAEYCDIGGCACDYSQDGACWYYATVGERNDMPCMMHQEKVVCTPIMEPPDVTTVLSKSTYYELCDRCLDTSFAQADPATLQKLRVFRDLLGEYLFPNNSETDKKRT